jgi:hypothetical protein
VWLHARSFAQRKSGNPRKGEEWHFQIVVMEQLCSDRVEHNSTGQGFRLLRGETMPKNTPHNRSRSPHLSDVSNLNSGQDVALYQNFHGVALHNTPQITVEGYPMFI